jgi:hypothetical protein
MGEGTDAHSIGIGAFLLRQLCTRDVPNVFVEHLELRDMYQFDRHERPPSTVPSGAYLTAEEIREVSELMYELRNVTLSRRTFKAASAFLARFAGETASPGLVPTDPLAE